MDFLKAQFPDDISPGERVFASKHEFKVKIPTESKHLR